MMQVNLRARVTLKTMPCLPRQIAALVLAALLPGSSLPVCASVTPNSDSAGASREDAKTLHLLNRMTFGPLPGQVQQVEAMGIDRWLDLQLHPSKIDDSALDQRLSEYRAPFMTPPQLMLYFPARNFIRQALNGRISVPSGEPQHAIWESQIAIVQQHQLNKQARAADQSDKPAAMKSDDMMPPPPIDQPDSSISIDPADLLALSPQQRYQKLLNLQPGQMPSLVRSLRSKDRAAVIAGMTPEQRETVIALINPRLVVVNENEAVRLQRDIYSQRQLQRVMTEFWLNHFNIYTNKNQLEPYYLPQFENDVIATHALGKFEDLLDAVAHSPAMLIYLDNVQSIGPDSIAALRREYPGAPRFQLVQIMNSERHSKGAVPSQFHNQPRSGINENYGRELMELHTVGVNGGYTQQDVIEAARVLTGWTVAPPRQGGGFRYEPNRHEPGDKIVMGHRIKNGGENEGAQLLHILATSPATAHFISQELAVRFVSDHPSTALVDRMAATFLSTRGDIAKVLKTMIDSPEFWSASDTGNKIKTPLDYVVSAVRAANADVSQPYRLVSELRSMGMPLTGTEQPNGYSMDNNVWTSSSELIDRMNFALALAANQIPGVTVSIGQLLGSKSAAFTPDQQEAQLEQALLHGPAPAKVRQTILQSLNDTALQNRAAVTISHSGDAGGDPFSAGIAKTGANPQQAIMAGLLLGSPEFQRR